MSFDLFFEPTAGRGEELKAYFSAGARFYSRDVGDGFEVLWPIS